MNTRRPGTPAMGKQIEALFRNQIIRCYICGDRIYFSDKKHWDHRVEWQESQCDLPDNCWPVHVACHLRKSGKKNSERRHIDRLAKVLDGKPKRARDKFKQKIPSRPFPKRNK